MKLELTAIGVCLVKSSHSHVAYNLNSITIALNNRQESLFGVFWSFLELCCFDVFYDSLEVKLGCLIYEGILNSILMIIFKDSFLSLNVLSDVVSLVSPFKDKSEIIPLYPSFLAVRSDYLSESVNVIVDALS